MPTNFTSNSFSSTYNDDWEKERAYHKVLFHGGRALQARELNEMQSIIQAEIARLGSNLFKNGSMVNPGGTAINSAYEYVRLNPEGGQPTISHIGKTLTGATSGVQAQVLQYVAPLPNGVDPATFYVKYIDDGTQTATNSGIRFTQGEVLTSSGGAGSITVESAGTDPLNPPVGKGCSIQTTEGDFFVSGHLVNVPGQHLILSKYTPLFTGEVGFQLIQDIVTVSDTTSLYDNQGGTPNLSSPGADRYRIRLILIDKSFTNPDDSYIQLCSVKQSVITKFASNDDTLKINHLLAKRTSEESGDYSLNPYRITLGNVDSAGSTLAENNFLLTVSKGVSYVKGYRCETTHPTELIIDKPTAIETKTNEFVSIGYEQYVTVNATDNKNLPSFYSSVNLYDAVGGTGTILGTAAVRQLEEDPAGNYRLHLINLEGASLSTGDGFRNVKSVGTGTSDFFNTVQIGSSTKLISSTTGRKLSFKLNLPRAQSFGTGDAVNTDVTYSVQRDFPAQVANGSGEITINQPFSNYTFTDTNDWIVSSADSAVNTRAFSVTNNSTAATITNLLAGQTYDIFAYMDVADATPKTKTKVAATATGTITADSDFPLGYPDVYEITSLKDSASGEDISNYFKFNRNVFDAYYGESRLDNLKGYAGPVYAGFNYLQRGASGHYYSVNSYSSLNYAQIPSYLEETGGSVSARDMVDFRPDYVNGTYSNKFDVPKQGTNITTPVSYYLPRADKLVIGIDGVFRYVRGKPARKPQFRKTPEDTLELYKLIVNGNMLNPRDTSLIKPIDNRRYTMRDIAELDKRFSLFQKEVELSLSELKAKNCAVLDSNGGLLTSAGFLVDEFVNNSKADTTDANYRASIHPKKRELRPSFNVENIRLIKNTNTSTCKFIGDYAMLDYKSVDYISQPLASSSMLLNPYVSPEIIGTIVLSPETDDWKQTMFTPDKIVDNGREFTPAEGSLYQEDVWGWTGEDTSQLEEGEEAVFVTPEVEWIPVPSGEVVGQHDAGIQYVKINYNTKIISSEVILETIGTREVSVVITPWMRARKIYFKAEGLKPNTTVYAYFGKQPVSNWCRAESTFVLSSDVTADISNTNANATEHPDGTTALVTDNTGALIGSFYIPCQISQSVESVPFNDENDIEYRVNTNKAGQAFKTGTQIFTLLDVQSFNNSWTCKAEMAYTAEGTLRLEEKTVSSTRLLTYSNELTSTTSDVNGVATTVTIGGNDGGDVVNFDNINEDVDITPHTRVTSSLLNFEGADDGLFNFALGDNATVTNQKASGLKAENLVLLDREIETVQALVLSDGYTAANTRDGVIGSVSEGGIVEGTSSYTSGGGYGANSAIDGGALNLTQTGAGTNTSNADGLEEVTSEQAVNYNATNSISNISTASTEDVTQYFDAYHSNIGELDPRRTETKDNRDPNHFETGSSTFDPMAQTFYIDQSEGVYITDVKLYFDTIDATKPVKIQIRPVENGRPSSKIISGSEKLVNGSTAVSVSAAHPSGPTLAQIKALPTTFTFDEPVYLNGGEEYAICILSPNTNGYRIYVGEVDKFCVGSTQRKISQSNDNGLFFKPQNSQNWQPSRNFDLMYSLTRAKFVKEATLELNNAAIQSQLLPRDPLRFISGDSDVRVVHNGHGHHRGDAVIISGLDSSTVYAGITGANLMGSKTIVNADYSGYTFKAPTTATATTIKGGTVVKATENFQFTEMTPKFDNIVPRGCSLTGDIKLISGRSFAGQETRFVKDTVALRVNHKDRYLLDRTSMIANPVLEAANVTGGAAKSVELKLNLKSNSDFVTPKVDLQRCSIDFSNNKIDNQIASSPSDTESTYTSANSAGNNIPIAYFAETDATRGSAAAKHITVPLELVEDATRLRISLKANCPNVANFDLYYRTTVKSGTPIKEVDWTLQTPKGTIPKTENSNDFREFVYEKSELTAFNIAQFKIVFRSSNNIKVPRIREFVANAYID
jgi:uncharacterized small protein (DUF1192 family)